jgi:hypothetical protein
MIKTNKRFVTRLATARGGRATASPRGLDWDIGRLHVDLGLV